MLTLGIECNRPAKRWIARCRSTCCSSVRPLFGPLPIAVTSPPAQKPRPAPVSTMQPTPGSPAQRSSAAIAVSIIDCDSAFSRSGRFMVSVATPSRMSTSRSASFGFIVDSGWVAWFVHRAVRSAPRGRRIRASGSGQGTNRVRHPSVPCRPWPGLRWASRARVSPSRRPCSKSACRRRRACQPERSAPAAASSIATSITHACGESIVANVAALSAHHDIGTNQRTRSNRRAPGV